MNYDVNLAPPKVSEVLREYFMTLEGVTQDRLAEAMGVSRHSINELLNGRRAVTAAMALRLSRALGTDPEVWLNLQTASDLFLAKRRFASELEAIPALRRKPTEEECVRSFDEVFKRADKPCRRSPQ